MYKQINSNRFRQHAAILLGLILSSAGAIAQPAFAANTENNAQVYNYSAITHSLINSQLGSKANGIRPKEYIAYTIGSAPIAITNSFKTTSGTVADTNFYNKGLNIGITKEHWDANGNVLSYSYNYNGVKLINYYKIKSGANSNISNKPPRFHITYQHNTFGKVEIIARDPGLKTYNTYGANSRLDKIALGRTSGATAAESYAYHYGAGGNLISVTITSNTSKAQGQITYQYSYNDKNQLTGFNTKDEHIVSGSNLNPTDVFGSPIQYRSYSYGLNSNINTVTTVLHTKASAQEKPAIIMAYFYNQSIGEPNQLVNIKTISQVSGYPYESQMAGLNAKDYSYNPYGGITKDPEGDAYQYNDLNQMIAGANKVTGSKQIYQYGSNSLLAYEKSTIHNKYTKAPYKNTQNGKPVFFFYAGGVQPQEQQQGIDNQTASKNFHIPGLATFNNQKGRTDLYEVAQGNVALTTTTNKQNPAQINNQYSYAPYGQQNNLYQPQSLLSGQNGYAKLIKQTLHPLDISKNRFGYTGQATDSSTGLMMLGNFRNYAPDLGRFIQPDTYNPFAKVAVYNTYTYVRGNPLTTTDPSGHAPGDDDEEHPLLSKNNLKPKEMTQEEREIKANEVEEREIMENVANAKPKVEVNKTTRKYYLKQINILHNDIYGGSNEPEDNACSYYFCCLFCCYTRVEYSKAMLNAYIIEYSNSVVEKPKVPASRR